MKLAFGSIQCKAIYRGTTLLWELTESGEYLNGAWVDSQLWKDSEVWKERHT